MQHSRDSVALGNEREGLYIRTVRICEHREQQQPLDFPPSFLPLIRERRGVRHAVNPRFIRLRGRDDEGGERDNFETGES